MKTIIRYFFPFTLAILIPFILGACATSGSQENMSAKEMFVERCMAQNNTKRTNSTVIGSATTGIVVGLLKKDLGAAIAGAVVGGGVGYTVGYQLDKQECELQYVLYQNAELAGKVAILKDSENGLLTLIGDNSVTFKTGSAEISPAFKKFLNDIGNNMRQYNTSCVVHGYTDNVGGVAYNQALSERRAEEVAMVIQRYVPSTRAIGHGISEKYDDLASNRRVELEFQTHQ